MKAEGLGFRERERKREREEKGGVCVLFIKWLSFKRSNKRTKQNPSTMFSCPFALSSDWSAPPFFNSIFTCISILPKCFTFYVCEN